MNQHCSNYRLFFTIYNNCLLKIRSLKKVQNIQIMPKDKSFSFLPFFVPHTKISLHMQKKIFKPQNHVNSFTFDIGQKLIYRKRERTKWLHSQFHSNWKIIWHNKVLGYFVLGIYIVAIKFVMISVNKKLYFFFAMNSFFISWQQWWWQ